MMNKALIGDRKDVEIARLKMIIEKFKKYDKDRTEFYAKKMQRLGELESYVIELEEKSETGKLEAKIKELRGKLSDLNKVILYNKMVVPEKEQMNLCLNYNNLKNRNRNLSDENKRLRDTISQLVTRLNKLENGKEAHRKRV